MPLVIILWRSTLWCLLEIDVYCFYLLNHWNIIPLNYLQVYGCVITSLGLLPTQKSNSLLAMLPLINSSRSYFCSWPLSAVQSTSEVQDSRVTLRTSVKCPGSVIGRSSSLNFHVQESTNQRIWKCFDAEDLVATKSLECLSYMMPDHLIKKCSYLKSLWY